MPPRLVNHARARSSASLPTDSPSGRSSQTEFNVHGNGLYGGPERESRAKGRKMKSLEDMSNDELVKQAAETHAETTMNAELTYAEKLLRYMSRANAAKEEAEAADAIGSYQGVASGDGSVPSSCRGSGVATSTMRQSLTSRKASSAKSSGARRSLDPDIRLPDEHSSTATAMQAQTREQNSLIDQIGSGLDHLMHGAHAMDGELKAQNKHLDSTNDKLDGTSGRMKDMNSKSLLSTMPGYKKKR
eukprot:gene16650-22901_t